MGAYLNWKCCDKKQAEKINEFTETLDSQQFLMSNNCGMFLYSQKDVDWCKKYNKASLLFVKKYIGECHFKVSGWDEDTDDIFEKSMECVSDILYRVSQKYKIKISSGSCALRNDYFTLKQIRKMTNNGEILSKKPYEDYKQIIDLIKTKGVKTIND